MTNPKWLIGIAVLFIGLSAICSWLGGSYFEGAPAERLQALMSMPFPPTLTWAGNFWAMLWFDYPAIFHGNWLIFKYILFWPISFGLIVSYGFLLLQALVTAARSLISLATGGRL
jgi:hypothetical protein